MLDFPYLRHRWTEAGARDVFAELVTQCVRSQDPTAATVRPAPGDDGVDVFVGAFGQTQRVWQAKFFLDGLNKSQKSQITRSWNACVGSGSITNLVEWTLCLPIDLSISESKWWDGWRKTREEEFNCKISLWTKSNFVSFKANPGLSGFFDMVFGDSTMSLDAVLDSMRLRGGAGLRDLPEPALYSDAVFVRKLEAAGVQTTRARRTAFYNFDVLRIALNEGGDDRERVALEDLLVRTRDLWEQEHATWSDEAYGRKFVGHVDTCVSDSGRLPTSLPMHAIHKKGGLYSIADMCDAYWTAEPTQIGDEGPK